MGAAAENIISATAESVIVLGCLNATHPLCLQVRFEVSYYALKPDIKVIAPWREWDLGSRTDMIAYAEKNDIPVPAVRSCSNSIAAGDRIQDVFMT